MLNFIIFVMGLVGSNYPMKAEAITVAHSFLSHLIKFAIMDNSKEIWKDVIGYEGLYQVSNLGRVKSLKFSKERIISAGLGKIGYYTVSLFSNKVRKYKNVHQLVAESFLNHIPNGYKLVVNHIDFNKQNNHISNLEIITNRENTNKKHIKSSSKYTGVSFNKSAKKWVAKIRDENSKLRYLGYYNKEYDAHLAYEKELKIVLHAKEHIKKC